MNEKLKQEIHYYNKKSYYKIRYRKRLYDYALYLDLQQKGIRQTINLDLHVSGKISFFDSDKTILNHAVNKQRKYDEQFKFGDNSSVVIKKKLQEGDFISFLSAIADKKRVRSTRKNWYSVIKHIKNFSDYKIIKFKNIDKNFCQHFAEYLTNKVSANTGNLYFGQFKQALYKAIDLKLLDNNPASRISIKKKSTNREFLTINEIQKINELDFHLPQLKEAFIFACFTGLRFVDIKDIRFEQIENSTLIFTQKKTAEPLRIKLHTIAQNIIERQKQELNRNSGLIFNLPGYEQCRINMHRLIKKAGINKKITFHCGRHTFATMCLTYDIDIYTVSKLLGHTDVKHTQIYAKLIDKKRDEAIDKLPSFETN